VSLDGPDAVTHDWLRGRGAFARVRAGLDLLVRHGVAVNIAMTVHRLNACAMEAVLRAGVAVGARTVGFLMIDRIDRALAARWGPGRAAARRRSHSPGAPGQQARLPSWSHGQPCRHWAHRQDRDLM
jgi:sulfatase maturation enzyme AslB (radical SAM superfamily)